MGTIPFSEAENGLFGCGRKNSSVGRQDKARRAAGKNPGIRGIAWNRTSRGVRIVFIADRRRLGEAGCQMRALAGDEAPACLIGHPPAP